MLHMLFDDLDADTPSRTTEIEVAGFPFGLGAEPTVSPLVVTTRVASALMETPQPLGGRARFLYLSCYRARHKWWPCFFI